jgi:hypothetical protein
MQAAPATAADDDDILPRVSAESQAVPSDVATLASHQEDTWLPPSPGRWSPRTGLQLTQECGHWRAAATVAGLADSTGSHIGPITGQQPQAGQTAQNSLRAASKQEFRPICFHVGREGWRCD